jgi:hypothetical protein
MTRKIFRKCGNPNGSSTFTLADTFPVRAEDHRCFIRNPHGKKPFGTSSRRSKDNIETET